MKQSIQKTNARSLFSRCAKKVTACILSTVLLLACCPLALAAEHDPDPLTAQELAQMTDEQIAALSQEQSDATLNKMAQLFQDGEKQALDEYLSSLGFATTYEEYAEQQGWNEEEIDTEPSIQPMWSSEYLRPWKDQSDCHARISQIGFLIYVASRNLTFNSATIGYSLADMQTLATQSEWPDVWDIGVLYDSHFYDPDTGTNWRGNSTPTARTKAEDYYNKAVNSYRSGDRDQAIEELGRCLHFVQDSGEPHHASNKTTVDSNSNHSDFEKEASQWLYDGTFVFDLEENFDYTLTFYNGFISRSVGGSVHTLASGAKGLINAAESSVQGARILAAFFLLGSSMQYTSGILYKFARDVGMI